MSAGGQEMGARRVFNETAMIAVLQAIRHELHGQKDWRPGALRSMRRDAADDQLARAAVQKTDATRSARNTAEDAAWLKANRPANDPHVRQL